MAHLLVLLRSWAWRVPRALQSVKVCVGLCAGAEEEPAISSVLTAFHLSAASSSVLMCLPGFRFCFEASWVSRLDVVSVFPCAQFLSSCWRWCEVWGSCRAPALLSLSSLPLTSFLQQTSLGWVAGFLFLFFFPPFVLNVEKCKVLPALMFGRCVENQWDFHVENLKCESLD